MIVFLFMPPNFEAMNLFLQHGKAAIADQTPLPMFARS